MLLCLAAAHLVLRVQLDVMVSQNLSDLLSLWSPDDEFLWCLLGLLLNLVSLEVVLHVFVLKSQA